MRILLAGGGTGGHLIPAINIARLLKKKLPDVQFMFVGIKGGMEKEIVRKNGFNIEEIEVVGLKRNFTGMIDFSRKIMRAYKQADKIVRGFGPEVVVGTGGYLSAPVVLAGKRRKARVLIQEQNIFPGLATRFLARFADRTCLAFDSTRKYLQGMKHLIVTGNPLRDDLIISKGNGLINEFGLKSGKKVLFITGGSRGAQSLNDGITEIDFSGRVMPFIDSMPKAYAVADLVVWLLAIGLPAILVPYPYATADHQMKNALDLKRRNAVEVIADSKVKTDEFVDLLSDLMHDDNRREKLIQNARLIGNTNGAESITEEIVKLI